MSSILLRRVGVNVRVRFRVRLKNCVLRDNSELIKHQGKIESSYEWDGTYTRQDKARRFGLGVNVTYWSVTSSKMCSSRNSRVSKFRTLSLTDTYIYVRQGRR
jgi:hypothetical protein